jgi:spore coat polysaccharide biosynthesis protein SpsF (cytidylyltransferase family)
MTPVKPNEDEKAAIDALVQEGVTREYAEELVQTHGTNWETLKAAAFAKESAEESDSQQSEHT